MTCEKCWTDAGGDMARYVALLRERYISGAVCTPRQQCGARHTRSPYSGTCACGEFDTRRRNTDGAR